MKLLHLYIKNLASIGEANIDFTRNEFDPARYPLFLICGNTGAGKSTIIDAICLALYKDTPRLHKVSGRSQFFGKDELTPKDTAHLLRHGTSEAQVILTFLADNGHQYEAEWSVRRNRNKKIESAKNLLRDKTDNITYESKECEEQIERIIKLSFDQFCRTVLLAQGEFTRFLKSEEKEKIEILEKLAGTSQFATIGKKIYEIQQRKDREKKELEQKLNDKQQDLLTDEQKRQCLLQQQTLSSKIQQAEAEQKQLNTQLQWLQQHNDLTQKLQEAKAKYEEAENTLNSAEFKEAEADLADYQLAQPLFAVAENEKKKQHELEVQQQAVTQLETKLCELLAGKLFLEQEQKNNQQKLSKVDATLEAEASRRSVYENIQTITANLKRLKEVQEDEKSKKESQQQLPERIAKQESEINDIEAKNAVLQQQLDEYKGKIAQTEAELQQLNPEETNQRATTLSTRQNSINDLKLKLSDYKAKKDQWSKEGKNKDEAATKIEELQATNAKLNSQLNTAKTEQQTWQQAYNAATLAIGDTAQQLRVQLKVGDICPVCGNKISELLSESNLQTKLQPIKEQKEAAEKQVQDLNTKIGTNIKLLEQNEQQKAQAQATYDQLLNNMKSLGNEILEGFKQLQIVLPEKPEVEIMDNAIEQAEQALETEQKQLAKTQHNIEQLQKEQNNLREKQNNLNGILNKGQVQKEKMKGELNRLKEQQKSGEQQLLELKQKAEELLAGLDEQLVIEDWHTQWDTDPQQFITTLSEEATAYNTNLKTRDSLATNIQQNQILLTQLAEQQRNIESLGEWNCPPQAPKTVQGNELLRNFNTFVSDATTTITQLNTLSKEVSDCTQKLQQFFAEHSSISEDRFKLLAAIDINELQKKHTAKRDALTAAKAELKTQQLNYDEQLKNRPEQLAENTTEEELQAHEKQISEQIKTLSSEDGEIKSKLQRNEEQGEEIKRLNTNLTKAREEFEQWNAFGKLLGDATGNTFQRIAQSFLLGDLLKHANYYLNQLSNRYELDHEPGTLNLRMNDLYEGTQQMPVNTLSGGESFLVSLALALGLSSVSQQGLNVDTLFIDEGFGTLSERERDAAITLLENLHSLNGKRVGIISHVSELRQRIPVHIEVARINNFESGVQIKTLNE